MVQDQNSTGLTPVDAEALNHIQIARAINRRRFMTGIGLAGAAVGAATLAGCNSDPGQSATAPTTSTALTDTDVLNFALNLEYFEATLYAYLATGADMPAASTSASGFTTVSGTVTGAPTKLSGAPQQVVDLINEIYFDELSHVNDLRSLLGNPAVARPNLNLSAVTTTNYLSLARLIEDVGVTAYAGAAPLLTVGANVTAAAQILAVEGFHSGALRLLAIQTAGTPAAPATPDGYDVKPADPGTTALAQAGPTSATGGFFATAGASSAQTNTFAGFSYKRSTSQVLAIVYGSATAGTTSGGFFPNGLNGNIKTV